MCVCVRACGGVCLLGCACWGVCLLGCPQNFRFRAPPKVPKSGWVNRFQKSGKSVAKRVKYLHFFPESVGSSFQPLTFTLFPLTFAGFTNDGPSTDPTAVEKQLGEKCVCVCVFPISPMCVLCTTHTHTLTQSPRIEFKIVPTKTTVYDIFGNGRFRKQSINTHTRTNRPTTTIRGRAV